MAKFGGIILSVNHFDKPGQSGGAGVVIKVTTQDGVVKEPILVDIKREDAAFIKLLQANNGLATSAQVTFEAQKILDWQAGVDRNMPAYTSPRTGEVYPEQPVHQAYGYVKGSLNVIRWVKGVELKDETDETKINYAKRLSFATLMDKAVAGVKSAVGAITGNG